ncbi:MAG TPA: CBS domain-containing protein [Candidatus Anaerobiospirillum pullistercoris]|uniref:CBS domain-containing protein n=1 Tax=Candidatus Anaerobiospirillum pullistercoris TaxID=2838452 RepID=A0A9D1WDS6_9GAMM|nr:CBS domain-containing protein [Candidatus Anaerobiospirillum pullistercoris]
MDPVAVHQVMFDMAWVSDPTAWLGMLTLVVIEIVLGIDNLVFIAILTAKLPENQRDRARYIGLGGALVIRLLLLTFISFIVNMTKPLFTIGSFGVTGRDIVMMIGGLFLLYKATHELHSKLEGFDEELSVSKAAGSAMYLVILQIMVLDAVFSLDSIVTAIGMVDHIFIMMFAVVIAMAIMTLASRFITEFVNHHPTLVILCLGFLLMIGFSLIVEALGFHVPKGYMYAAIGFSLLIEIFNQIARNNTLKLGEGRAGMQSREIAANLVLRLLGSNQNQVHTLKEAIVSRTGSQVFNNTEKEMVSRVLQLSSLPVKAVMTARTDVNYVDISDSMEEIMSALKDNRSSRLVVYKDGKRDVPLGYIRRDEIFATKLGLSGAFAPVPATATAASASSDSASAETQPLSNEQLLEKKVREPLYLPETVSVIKALEEFRKSKKNFAFVFDEFGNFEGIVTLHDIMEEIAGELPDQTEVPELVRINPGVFKIEGDAILKDVSRLTGFNVPISETYHTIAGFILDYLQRVPEAGEVISMTKWKLEILKVEENTIKSVLLTNLAKAKENEKNQAKAASK